MRRQRPVNSCLPCRRRRVRCDKVHPACGRCRAARMDCSYDHSALAEATDSTTLPAAVEHSVTTAILQGQPPHVQASAPSHTSDRESSTLDSQVVVGPPYRRFRERGQFFSEDGGRSTYIPSTFWANPIQSEYQHLTQSNARNMLHLSSKWVRNERYIAGWRSQMNGMPYYQELRWPNAVHPSNATRPGNMRKLVQSVLCDNIPSYTIAPSS